MRRASRGGGGHVARVRDEAPGPVLRQRALAERSACRRLVRESLRHENQFDVCFEKRLPVFLSGLGDPKRSRTKSTPPAFGWSQSAAARRRRSSGRVQGVGAVIVQDNEAGGHVGSTSTLTLGQAAVRAMAGARRTKTVAALAPKIKESGHRGTSSKQGNPHRPLRSEQHQTPLANIL